MSTPDYARVVSRCMELDCGSCPGWRSPPPSAGHLPCDRCRDCAVVPMQEVTIVRSAKPTRGPDVKCDVYIPRGARPQYPDLIEAAEERWHRERRAAQEREELLREIAQLKQERDDLHETIRRMKQREDGR